MVDVQLHTLFDSLPLSLSPHECLFAYRSHRQSITKRFVTELTLIYDRKQEPPEAGKEGRRKKTKEIFKISKTLMAGERKT